MNIDKAYSILKIDKNCSFDEVKKSYKDLVQIWHPDRFVEKERLKKKATEELKLINEAYNFIKVNYNKLSNDNTNNAYSGNDDSCNYEIITCVNCGAKNKVNLMESLGREIICGKCKSNVNIKSYKHQSNKNNTSGPDRKKNTTSHTFLRVSPAENKTKLFCYIPFSNEYLILTTLFTVTAYLICRFGYNYNLNLYLIPISLFIYTSIVSLKIFGGKTILLYVTMAFVYMILFQFCSGILHFFNIKNSFIINFIMIIFFTSYYYFILAYSNSVSCGNKSISNIFYKIIIVYTIFIMIILFLFFAFGPMVMRL